MVTAANFNFLEGFRRNQQFFRGFEEENTKLGEINIF